MLKIYGLYRSRASRNIWLCEELGLPFQLVPVVQHYRKEAAPSALHTKSPEFLKVNPNSHVPTIDDDGLVLHESLAINLYLARKHGGPIAGKNVAEEGEMAMWALWSAIEVEGHAINIVYHRSAAPPAGTTKDPKLADTAEAALKAPFAVLDKAVAGGWLVGGRFTVADLNAAEVVRYAMGAPKLFDGAPNVKKWLAACQARPAFKKMWAARDAEPA